MIENALNLRNQINAAEKNLQDELGRLELSGHAKWISWFDKYDAHYTCVISDNKELLSKVTIDGFTDNDDYVYCDDDGAWKPISRDSEELIRIKEF